MKRTALAIFCLFLTAPLFAQRPPWSQSELDSYVSSVMKEFRVPGIGLAVVKDGRVVVAKGYGVR